MRRSNYIVLAPFLLVFLAGINLLFGNTIDNTNALKSPGQGAKNASKADQPTKDTIEGHLSAREALSLPKPDCKKMAVGVDIVWIVVDLKGNVVEVHGAHNGSDITDKTTIECDENAAKKSKFSSTGYGPEKQYGTIVYTHKKH